MTLFRPLVLALLLFCVPGHCAEPKKVSISRNFQADAQLNLKSSYEQGEPIRVGCTCNPGPDVKLSTEWAFSSGLQAIDIDDLTKDVWAKPGTNKISVKLKLLRTHKLTVFVPDPASPTDITKAKLQVIEVFDGYTESVLDGEFVQKGAVDPVPVPPPGPPPPPPPPPSPVTSGPLRVMILEEADDRRDNKYPAQVVTGYQSSAVFSYLGSHGAANFKQPVTFDDDYAAGQLTKAGYTTDVEDAYQAAKVASGANTAAAKEPWMTVQQADSTGKFQTVYSGEVFDEARTLKVLQKFGGP